MAPITEQEKQFLHRESHRRTLKYLARHSGLSAFRIQEYCRLHDLPIAADSPAPKQKQVVKKKRPVFHEPPVIQDSKRKTNRQFPGDRYSNSSPFGIAKNR